MPRPFPLKPFILTLLILALVGCQNVLTGCQNKPGKANQANPAPVVPTSKLSENPGAPMVVEEVDEAPAGTPLAIEATNPTPTVTDTTIPTQLIGLTFQGSGQAGGPQPHPEGDFGVDVYGNGGNARNIAFLIDASGSMDQALPFIARELNRVINTLKPAHNITILTFCSEGVAEAPGGGGVRGLRSATPEFKEDIRQWLNPDNKSFETGGAARTHAKYAILRALSYRPQIVYVLSDNLTGTGKHELNQDDLIKTITNANDFDPPAKFHTIQFFKEDPLVAAGLTGTLQRLADETGGNYKFISKRDLNLR